MNITEKYELLINYIKPYNSLAIALSGGIDSTFLLHAANETLGHENVMAFTIHTAYLPERDLDDATEFCKNLNIPHIIIESLVPDHLRPNPVDRCYFCKRFEFSLIITKAREYGIDHVAAGLNADDPSDYRPGIKAMNELKVLYPLQAVSLSKPEIRELAKRENIKLWDKPANACILSRIPYGDFITDETIKRIQEAEKVLQNEGFINPRVRTHGKVASIEVEKEEIVKFTNKETSLRIFDALKKIGYQNVTLDKRGYRTGSLNEGITDQLKK